MEGCTPMNVTVYGSPWCPHCKETKNTLTERGIGYIDINVTQYPQIRDWLKDRSQASSIPQVFFNGHHVGGNAELQTLLKDKLQWEEFVKNSNEEKHPVKVMLPQDVEETVKEATDSPPDPLYPIALQLLSSPLNRPPSTSCFRTHTSYFTGEELVTWCLGHCDGDEKAVEISSELLSKRYIVEQNFTSEFSREKKYRVNSCSSDSVLNAGDYSDRVIGSADSLSQRVRESLLNLYAQYLSDDGKNVDYHSLKASPSFLSYQSLARDLQRVDLYPLNVDERKAFFLNIYNAMVVHGLALNGAPKNFVQQMKFYGDTTYAIAGQLFSLNDIEHGVLRGNKPMPAKLFSRSTFSSSDHRTPYIVPLDPRIHFALNCGAQSCPPISTYSPHSLDSDLTAAAVTYMSSDEGVGVEGDKVMLTSLMRWYGSDFGATDTERLQWIIDLFAASRTAEVKLQALTSIVTSEQKPNVQWMEYDWSHNGK